MKPSNRRTQQPYVPPKSGHNGGDGFYIFVPSSALSAVTPSAAPFNNIPRPGDALVPAPPSAAAPQQTIGTLTFGEVAKEWFQVNQERWVESYRVRLRSRLDEDLVAIFGTWRISEIRPLDLLSAMRKIEDRGAIETAKRILNMASSVFRYGVATGQCFRDPTADIKDALRPPARPKRRIALPAKEIPQFMIALSDYDGEQTTKLALRLLIHTFVRTGELRFAKWNEFEDLDGPEPLWRIPAERMKLRRPHLVPLSPQAVASLESLHSLTGRKAHLFPAPSKTGVMSENTLLFAIYRMGYHNRATVHGFRATASTILNEAQFNRDWIEMQLAHCDSSIRGVYNFAEWMPGRRKMMNWWADYLENNALASC